MIDAVRDRVPPAAVSTGTVRFSADHPLPEDVVRDLVRLRAMEIKS